MSSWELVPCLVKLRSEFNEIAPNRDKASDGTVGDLAHQERESDHNPDETGNVPIRDADKANEVHALDIDVDLRMPGLTMERVVQFLLARCRSGAETRLRYIIYNYRIWRASNGWRQEPYSGANPHNHHGHFSASYETKKEASMASWHLEDIDMPLNEADKKWLSGEIRKIVKEELDDHSRDDGDTTPRKYSRDGLVTTIEQDTKKTSAKVDQLTEKVDEVLKRLTAPGTN